MKRLIMLILMVLLATCAPPERPETNLELAIGEFWSFDATMALAIREAESYNGRWTFRLESTNIYHEAWVQRIPGIKQKFRAYGWDVISSCGDWQCFYPCALVNGFQGSPYELRNNIYTNAKYSALVYQTLLHRYGPDLNDVVSAYNAGHPFKNRRGEYKNRKYQERVMTNYNRWLKYDRD